MATEISNPSYIGKLRSLSEGATKTVVRTFSHILAEGESERIRDNNPELFRFINDTAELIEGKSGDKSLARLYRMGAFIGYYRLETATGTLPRILPETINTFMDDYMDVENNREAIETAIISHLSDSSIQDTVNRRQTEQLDWFFQGKPKLKAVLQKIAGGDDQAYKAVALGLIHVDGIFRTYDEAEKIRSMYGE